MSNKTFKKNKHRLNEKALAYREQAMFLLGIQLYSPQKF